MYICLKIIWAKFGEDWTNTFFVKFKKIKTQNGGKSNISTNEVEKEFSIFHILSIYIKKQL